MLGGAMLTPLSKPDGGIRPLAVGEALRRLTAKAICLQMSSAFHEDLKAHQYAVAVGAGCETVHKCVSAIVDSDSDVVVTALDVQNAYNSIQRLHCLQAVRRYRPELARFVEL
eukprot:6976389-Karenia_brevis.AAC.1